MKRFILSCCMLAVTGTTVFAQVAKSNNTTTQATSQSTAPTRAEFTSKISEFEASASHGNMKAADDRFTDLKRMLVADFHGVKMKIVNAPNETEKGKWQMMMNKKQAIYNDVITAAADMKGNYKVMVKKFRELAATI